MKFNEGLLHRQSLQSVKGGTSGNIFEGKLEFAEIRIRVPLSFDMGKQP